MKKIETQIQEDLKNKSIEDLEKENKIIENRQLLQEIKYSKKRWNFFISILTAIVIPVIFFFYTQYANEKERLINERQIEINKKEVALKDIEIQIKLMNFFLANYEQIFSKDTSIVHNISQVFAVFPTKYTTELFTKIKELSTEQNKKIWEEKEEIAFDIEGISATIDYYNNDYELKTILEQSGYAIKLIPSTYNNINTIWCSDNTQTEIIKNLALILTNNGYKIDVITRFKGKRNKNRKNYFTIGDHAETELEKIQNWNKTKIKTMTWNDIK